MNTSKKMISIIVPVYNVQDYLVQCIDSIINQDYKNIEIILVDDGSTDESGQMCDKYARVNSFIHVIHKENGGVVSARQAGLETAKGDYIGFVDSDDYIEPCMFRTLLKLAVEKKADFVNSSLYLDGRKVFECDEKIIEFDGVNRYEFLNSYVFDNPKIPSIMCTKLFKADLIKKVHRYLPSDLIYGEDLWILCACILECKIFYLCAEGFYHYRVRNESLSHCKTTELCQKESKLYSELIKLMKKYDKTDQCVFGIKQKYISGLISAVEKDEQSSIYVQRYKFQNIELLEHKKIVIYGAGRVGRDYYSQISRYQNCQIVAWTDRDYNKKVWENVKLVAPQSIRDIDFDLIIIAVKEEANAKSIMRDIEACLGEGTNCIWKSPVKLW